MVQYTMLPLDPAPEETLLFEENKDEDLQESFLMLRSFENVNEFIKQAGEILTLLNVLTDYNLKFQSRVTQYRAKTLLMKKNDLVKSTEVWEQAISGSLVSDQSNAHDSIVSETWENQLNNSCQSFERRNTELSKPTQQLDEEPDPTAEDGNLC